LDTACTIDLEKINKNLICSILNTKVFSNILLGQNQNNLATKITNDTQSEITPELTDPKL
jgi:hypothetical protein